MARQIIAGNDAAQPSAARFAGFLLPTSNTTYTPNQFFDVCLPHSSRGCVRLVAIMIRRTLGWCDEHGRPQHEQIRLSYADFEAAGIGRARIKGATAEAIQGGFIRCIRKGEPKTAGRASVSAQYELNWDESGEYIKDPEHFRGFFAGDGNRTYIPNQFFDHVVVSEPLAVVKVVGAIVRSSIGFANKWGHRRTLASLSYLQIQRYTKLEDRKSLAAALRVAMQSNYVERVEEGYFDPNGGVNSRKATYALKWLKMAADKSIGSETPPGKFEAEKSVPKADRHQFQNPTGDRFRNPTGLQITVNKTLKQQSDAASPKGKSESDEARVAAIKVLRDEGFDEGAANQLAERFQIERILRQIDWIDGRGVRRNRLGMLRRAIERDWTKPSEKLRRLNFSGDEADPSRGARNQLTERFKRITP